MVVVRPQKQVKRVDQWCFSSMKVINAEQWCFSIVKVNSAKQRCFSIVKARLSEVESSSSGGCALIGNLQNSCSMVFLDRDY
jgi:hypothetical protein